MSKETNLTSLKVYGNDDPAGSTYKVGGGADDLVLYMHMDSAPTDNQPLFSLVTASGESVTYQDLQNAITQGRQVCLVYTTDEPVGGRSAEYIDRLSILAINKIPSVPFMAVFSGVRILSFVDPDPTMTITPFGAKEETEPLRWPVDGTK